MKVLSLFSGIGAFERAIENKNIEHEIVNYLKRIGMQVMPIVNFLGYLKLRIYGMLIGLMEHILKI